MNLNINWRYPETKLEHYFLSMLLWRDLYQKGIPKEESVYFKYVFDFPSHCPLCEQHNACVKCILDGCGEKTAWWSWVDAIDGGRIMPAVMYAYVVYRRIHAEVIRLIKYHSGGLYL